MNHRLASILLICSAATAQSSATVVSPSTTLAKAEGSGSTTNFGAHAAARYQIADGNLRGAAKAISEVAFRHDHRNYNPATGMGRSWTSVSLHASECVLATLTTTFSTNPTTLQTKVFDGALTWPSQLTIPATSPASWALKWPFRSSYAYSGNKDLLIEFTFLGGSLGNSAGWNGLIKYTYALDSFGVGAEAEGEPAIIGRVNGGCRDTGAYSSGGAFLNFDTAVFGPQHANAAIRNTYFFEVTGSNFGSRVPTILVLAFGASTAGLVFPGVPCNKLHLELGRTWFLYPVNTNTIGNIAAYNFGVSNGLAPYNPGWHGINLFVQGIWNDSITGALKFSAGSRNSFMPMPLLTGADIKMKSLYDSNPFATKASQVRTGTSADIPITRYTY